MNNLETKTAYLLFKTNFRILKSLIILSIGITH